LVIHLSSLYLSLSSPSTFLVYPYLDNIEGAKAVVEAAEDLHSPIMIQIHPNSFHYGKEPFLSFLSSLKSFSSIPLYLHFDHFSKRSDIEKVFSILSSNKSNYGIDSIMIDGSHLSFEENLQFTKEMVSFSFAVCFSTSLLFVLCLLPFSSLCFRLEQHIL
jgi:fructose/tagatose bisphosphate aldolase